jgi:YegS/Rv2252/BmrU family lipid kinase
VSAFAIVNPRSGGGRTRRDWPKIERALRDAYPGVQIALTRGRGDATRLVGEALSAGHSEFVAVGGDGTINEVVNGLFGPQGPLAPDAVFAFVTSGTGGDFRKTFGIDAGYEAAIAQLRNAPVRALDVGRLSCLSQTGEPVMRHFVNIGSFGLSGVIVDRVNRARIAKLFGGTFAFAFHSARTMLSYREPIVRLRIDGHFDERASIATVAVANGQYFGGGMRVAPDAVPDDGLFDVVVMGGAGRGVGDLKLLYTGEHIGTPGVRVVRGRKVVAAPVEETGGRAVLIEVDGESAGRLPATFEILPRALRVRC